MPSSSLPLTRRQVVNCAVASSASLAVPLIANAQGQPDVLRLLCGFPAGGSPDAVTRWIGEKLTGVLARSVIVENRPGAAGRLVISALKSSPPDGRTMLMTPSAIVAMYPHVYATLDYDPVRDLASVSRICDLGFAIGVGPAVPVSVRNLADFAGWCKVHPEKASCANHGEGSVTHLLSILLSRDLGMKITPVPYRGSPPALNDLMGGQVAALIAPDGVFTQYVKDGKLRLLATSGSQRSRFFPQVATFAEQGAESVVVREWYGMFMHPQTPHAIVAKASESIAAAVRKQDIIGKFAESGLVGVGSTSADLALDLKTDLEFWKGVVKSSGFTPLSS